MALEAWVCALIIVIGFGRIIASLELLQNKSHSRTVLAKGNSLRTKLTVHLVLELKEGILYIMENGFYDYIKRSLNLFKCNKIVYILLLA